MNSLSYSKAVNGETIFVTRYDMNNFSIYYSDIDTSVRGTAYDIVEDLASHYNLKFDDIHSFAEINFNLDEPLMTTTVQGVAVSNVWMDSSARFNLSTVRAFDEWEIQGVIDFVIDVAEYINTYQFQICILKNMRIQDNNRYTNHLALIKSSFEDAKNSTERQNIVLVDDGIYLTFKAKLPNEPELQFGEICCWVEDETKEDETVYDSITNAIGDIYADTDDIINERIVSGKISFTKY